MCLLSQAEKKIVSVGRKYIFNIIFITALELFHAIVVHYQKECHDIDPWLQCKYLRLCHSSNIAELCVLAITILLSLLIWIIIHTRIVHAQMMCYSLDLM